MRFLTFGGDIHTEHNEIVGLAHLLEQSKKKIHLKSVSKLQISSQITKYQIENQEACQLLKTGGLKQETPFEKPFCCKEVTILLLSFL